MFNEDFTDNILKICFSTIGGILILLGIAFLCCLDRFPIKVEYYQNDIKMDAIEFHNEIYLKKGE